MTLLIAILIAGIGANLLARWLTDDKLQFEPDEHSQESIG